MCKSRSRDDDDEQKYKSLYRKKKETFIRLTPTFRIHRAMRRCAGRRTHHACVSLSSRGGKREQDNQDQQQQQQQPDDGEKETRRWQVVHSVRREDAQLAGRPDRDDSATFIVRDRNLYYYFTPSTYNFLDFFLFFSPRHYSVQTAARVYTVSARMCVCVCFFRTHKRKTSVAAAAHCAFGASHNGLRTRC